MINSEVTEEELKEWEKNDSETSENEENETEIDLENLRVIKQNQDYNIDHLITSIDKNIDLGPDYQRRSRWTKGQRSRLIESLLMNIPIPSIFLYEQDYYKYEVIDGKQRLEAIDSFFKNEYKLVKLEYLKNLEGKKFSDLEDVTKRLLYRRTITATILLVESSVFDKYDLRMILFNRLNTGGVKLNGQELRNAVNASSFNNLIMQLSTNSFFRDMWGIPIISEESPKKEKRKLENNSLYKNMMDCELVLRFFAIKEVYQRRITEGSMKALLDKTMKNNMKLSDEDLNEKRNLFESTVKGVVESLGKEVIVNPILKTPRRARNLYDSMLVAYSEVKEEEIQSKEIVMNNLKKVLREEKEYELIITKGNSIENILYRVDRAKEILTLIIE